MITCPTCARNEEQPPAESCRLCGGSGEVPTRLEWLTIRARLRALALGIGELPARVITPQIAADLRAARALLGLKDEDHG